MMVHRGGRELRLGKDRPMPADADADDETNISRRFTPSCKTTAQV